MAYPALHAYPSFHYYIRDHLGSNRMVVGSDGSIEQKNQYYPYGGPWGDISTNQGFQPDKYNAKELDRVHGLDWYDYGARMYDPAFCQFTQMDPLCEQYPHLSPYVYCAGNPVRYVDPDGEKPKPYEAALMAAAVYRDNDNYSKLINKLTELGWTISNQDIKVNKNLTSWYQNGLQTELFEKTKDGKTEYVYAFAGTNSLEDAVEDIAQLIGIAPQYYSAIRNAKIISKSLGRSELTFVGHSLGGGEAAASSMATGDAAITFNPASVSQLTQFFSKLGSAKNVVNYRTVGPSIKGTNIRLGGDPLNNIQDNIGLSTPGRTYIIPMQFSDPLTSHGIMNIVDLLSK